MANLIIGHTTETTARIWIRGNRKERRCDVVLEPGDDLKQRVRCEQEFDYTRVVDFDGLEPGVEYRVTATFSPEAIVHGRFTTPGAPVAGKPPGFSFVLSSCNLSVISINNFLAFLLATAGTSFARTSLEAQPDRWNRPSFNWLRRLWRYVLDKLVSLVAILVKMTTGIKQPGPPYLRSPFLKLAAIFDASIVDVELCRGAHLAVGDAVCTPGARGLIAALFLPKDPDDETRNGTDHLHDPKPGRARMVVLPIQGTLTRGRPLNKEQKSGEAGLLVGTIKEVWRAEPWYERPSFFIHAGDQIYYDFPRGHEPPDKDTYRLAYREAWFDDEPNRYLLSHWPHYMTLDDHEIADQFALDFKPTGDAFPSTYLDEAAVAYREYVKALGPQSPAATATSGHIVPFWYTFDRLAFEASPQDKRYARFFVLDTRTQRYSHGDRRQMIDRHQMAQLLGWMKRYKDDLKFVVTSVPFVAEISETGSKKTPRWPQKTTTPPRRTTRSARAAALEADSSRAAEPCPDDEQKGEPSPNPLNDKWSAQQFARQRHEIIEFIAEHEIEQLVFLTGDMHCCYHATMRIGSGLKYESITVHELAGGPVNQLQLADIDEFNRSCRRTTDKSVEYEVSLARFHSEVNGVLHLKVNYEERDQVTGRERAYAPEVEWNVIRTLTATEPSAWSKEKPYAPEQSVQKQPRARERSTSTTAEPVMRGRISFTRSRTPADLRRWG